MERNGRLVSQVLLIYGVWEGSAGRNAEDKRLLSRVRMVATRPNVHTELVLRACLLGSVDVPDVGPLSGHTALECVGLDLTKVQPVILPPVRPVWRVVYRGGQPQGRGAQVACKPTARIVSG